MVRLSVRRVFQGSPRRRHDPIFGFSSEVINAWFKPGPFPASAGGVPRLGERAPASALGNQFSGLGRAAKEGRRPPSVVPALLRVLVHRFSRTDLGGSTPAPRRGMVLVAPGQSGKGDGKAKAPPPPESYGTPPSAPGQSSPPEGLPMDVMVTDAEGKDRRIPSEQLEHLASWRRPVEELAPPGYAVYRECCPKPAGPAASEG